jgi:hypothetical protein
MMRQLLKVGVVLATTWGTQACYSYVPVDLTASPVVGERVALQISDQGRVGLSERLGPGVLRIEGTLTRTQEQDVSLNVFRVAQMGQTQPSRWSGESVTIPRSFIGGVQERKFNRGRTAVALGLATGVLAYLITQQNLFGFWEGTRNDPIEEPPPASNISVWRFRAP